MRSLFSLPRHTVLVVVLAGFLFCFPDLISGFFPGNENSGGSALWAQQNPFLSGSSSGGSKPDDGSAADSGNLTNSGPDSTDTEQAETDSPVFEGPPEKRVKPSRPESSSRPGRATGPLMGIIISLQRELYSRLAALMSGIKSSGNNPHFLFMLLLGACVYGMLHALGPGHRKTVIFSYFLAEDAKLLRGITAGVAMALLHGASAIGIILPLYYLVRGSLLVTFNSLSRYIELGTFLFIALFGAIMFVLHLVPHLKKKRPAAGGVKKPGPEGSSRPVEAGGLGQPSRLVGAGSPIKTSRTGEITDGVEERDPSEPEEPAATAATSEPTEPVESARRPHGLLLLIVGSGLVPCPGAAMILIFALSMGMVMTGVLAVAAMSIGMAITLSLVAVLSLGARGGLERSTRRNRRTAVVVHEVLELGGYGLIMIFGLVMALGMV